MMANAEAGILQSAMSSLSSIGEALIDPVLGDLGVHAKSMMTSVSNIDPKALVAKVASKALPSNFIGDALDMVGGLLDGAVGFLGLDNPTLPTEENRTIVKANGSMNYAVGPEYIEKLAILPSMMSLVTPETFGTVSDEMDTAYLYRKYSYVGRFIISKGDASGTVVWTVPMSPFPTVASDLITGLPLCFVGQLIQDQVYFPLLSYLGLPYRWWTGGLKFKFIVSASSLHTCRLFVAFNYGNWVKPTTLNDATSQYGTAIEVSQGSNEFEFAIPYVATTPYKEVCRGTMSPENSMGLLSVVILNPLIAPTTVADNIAIAVFIAGSDDFSYEYLASINPGIPCYAINPPSDLVSINEAEKTSYFSNNYSPYSTKVAMAESGVITMQTVAPTNVVPTVTDLATGEDDDDDIQVAPPQVKTQVDDHFGITGISLRNLAKKYQLISSFSLVKDGSYPNAPNYTIIPIYLASVLQTPTLVTYGTTISKVPSAPSVGLFNWMSAMYRQFKGGLRFKIIIDSSGQTTTPVVGEFTNAMVYYFPGEAPITPVGGVPLDLSTMIPQIVTTGMGGVSPDLYNLIYTPRLAIMNGRVSNVLEFEMPYGSRFLSTLTFSGNQSNFDKKEFGWLYLVVSLPIDGQYTATVYASLADEARFGTLYRVPSVYIPGQFSVSTGPPSFLNPESNFGFGTYRFVHVREDRQDSFDMANAESGVYGRTFNNSMGRKKKKPILVSSWNKEMDSGEGSALEMAKSAVTTTVQRAPDGQLANIPMNSQTGTGRVRGRVPWKIWFARKVRHYVAQHAGVRRDELMKFVNSISPINKPLATSEALERTLKRCGVYEGRDGDYGVGGWFRNNKSNRSAVGSTGDYEDYQRNREPDF
jgi:hypothetical protein